MTTRLRNIRTCRDCGIADDVEFISNGRLCSRCAASRMAVNTINSRKPKLTPTVDENGHPVIKNRAKV